MPVPDALLLAFPLPEDLMTTASAGPLLGLHRGLGAWRLVINASRPSG